MKSFAIKFTLLVVFAITFTAPVSAGQMVTAEGINQRQALNAALRQAVEMSLGTAVQANTLVENFQVVRQQILKHTQGYVRKYTILNEEKLPSGIVRLTIDAEVDDQSVERSTDALATLMKMAAHPKVLVAPIDDGFDAVSVLSDDFKTLSDAVETLLRDDFKFNVMDTDTLRERDQDRYRYTDRRNIMKRAKRAGVDFVLFVQLVKGKSAPLTLRLEGISIENGESLSVKETSFNTDNWTSDLRNHRLSAIQAASEVIHAPSAEIAVDLVENLRREAYEDGQSYTLTFQRFDPKKLEFLETDLTNLEGYVRHELTGREKKSLALSYWSMLKTGPLHDAISRLLDAQEITFQVSVKGRHLIYRYDDPMFE